MDFISAAAVAHMEEGCEAHRVFLGCAGYGDRTVLLIEDARLPMDLPVPSRVILAPWLFEGLDSAPCYAACRIRGRRTSMSAPTVIHDPGEIDFDRPGKHHYQVAFHLDSELGLLAGADDGDQRHWRQRRRRSARRRGVRRHARQRV